MGSDLFHVAVTAKSPTAVSLKVKSVHPDSGTPRANESFGIMLLREAADTGAFSDAVSWDDALDNAWQKKFARGFISKIAARDVTEGKRPQATIDITVTNPAWLAHVEKGATWDSRAFSLVQKFDKASPIAPEGAARASTDADDAFLWAPRAAWGRGHDLKRAPELLEIPAYSPTAYTIGEKIAKPQTVPKDWIGRAVRAEMWGRTDDGTLVSCARGQVTMATMGPSSYGSGGSAAGWIARLVPKAGRRGTKLSYDTVLGRVKVAPVSVSVKGKRATLTYRVPPGPRTLPVEDKAGIMWALRSGLRDEHGHAYTRAGKQSAFVKQLATDLETLGGDEWSLLDRLADSYVRSFSVAIEPSADPDAATPAEAKAIVGGEWPLATLEIEMSDAKLLAHLEKLPPHFETRRVEPPARPKRTPKPATKQKQRARTARKKPTKKPPKKPSKTARSAKPARAR